MIAIGSLCLLLVGYLLWGTGVLERQSQAALQRRFAEAVQSAQLRAVRAERTADARRHALGRPIPEGAPVDRLVIPAIGLDAIVVNGVTEQDLAQGPGHYLGTVLPGQLGNAAIAGHRTTYGAPFGSLNVLVPGDRILLTDRAGHRYLYRVDRRPFAVSPGNTTVLRPTPYAQLTLTTCNPRYWATQRLIVEARLVGPAPHIVGNATLVRTAAHQVNQAPATPGKAPIVLWSLTLASLWAGLRVGARTTRGWQRVAVVAAGVGASLVGLWFAFGAIVSLLPQSF